MPDLSGAAYMTSGDAVGKPQERFELSAGRLLAACTSWLCFCGRCEHEVPVRFFTGTP